MILCRFSVAEAWACKQIMDKTHVRHLVPGLIPEWYLYRFELWDSELHRGESWKYEAQSLVLSQTSVKRVNNHKVQNGSLMSPVGPPISSPLKSFFKKVFLSPCVKSDNIST